MVKQNIAAEFESTVIIAEAGVVEHSFLQGIGCMPFLYVVCLDYETHRCMFSNDNVLACMDLSRAHPSTRPVLTSMW